MTTVRETTPARALEPAPASVQGAAVRGPDDLGPGARRLGWRPSYTILVVVSLALLASITGLGNDFTFDDVWIIQKNWKIQDPSRWWQIFGESYWPLLTQGLYRPLTSLGFMLQWWAGGGSPAVFHVVNIALYAATCVAVWRLASLVLPTAGAFVAAAVFAVHPVHVEAVANVVGQSELWGGLLVVVAMTQFIRWRRDAAGIGGRRLLALGAMYLAALLAKENAIVLVALLVAAELTVVRDPRPWRARLAAVRPALLVILLVTIAYLRVRVAILGDWAGDDAHPALKGLSLAERAVGMIGILPEVGRLLVWPDRLYADHSPPHLDWMPQLASDHASGFVILLGTLVLLVAAWRPRPAAALGILWFVIAWSPTANIVVPTGILLAERTLFTPSIGFALMAGAAGGWLWSRAPAWSAGSRRLLAMGFGVLLVLGVARSATRTLAWKDNVELFVTTVTDLPLNAKAHYNMGGLMWDAGKLAEGEREWRTAIRLLPRNSHMRSELADGMRRRGRCADAVPFYQQSVALNGENARARAGLAVCLTQLGRHDEAIHALRGGYAWAISTKDLRMLAEWVESQRGAPAGAATTDPIVEGERAFLDRLRDVQRKRGAVPGDTARDEGHGRAPAPR